MQHITNSLQTLTVSPDQRTGLHRNPQDKYFTKREIALQCTNTMKKVLQHTIQPSDLFIEPSEGDGSFVEAITACFPTHKYYAFDIEPQKEGIETQDYLHYIPCDKQTIHVIGNPPFGRQSSQAKKFIKHSCHFAKSISFVLPKSFKKQSFQQTFVSMFHLLASEDLPQFSFLVNGEEYDVPCVFQVWVQKDTKREQQDKQESKHFTYVKKNAHPDFCIRRVGINAGTIYDTCDDKSAQSHYFCKLKSGSLESFMESYKNNVRFAFDNTVGPKSISKPELNEATNILSF